MNKHEVLAEIGGQHADLARQLDDFSTRLYSAEEREVAADHLREFLIAVSMHFGFEEGLMEEAGYPEFGHHRRQHMAIMTELGLLLDRIQETNDVAAVVRGIEFLRHWYLQHIAHGDAELEAWLRSSA